MLYNLLSLLGQEPLWESRLRPESRPADAPTHKITVARFNRCDVRATFRNGLVRNKTPAEAGEVRKEDPMSISPIMAKVAAKLQRKDLPQVKPGDTVRVQVRIKEGDKERVQAFEGVVIAHKSGPQASITVRKVSFGQGVERIFPLNSKVIDKIEHLRSSRVRRAKLFYLRGLKGKAARLRETESA